MSNPLSLVKRHPFKLGFLTLFVVVQSLNYSGVCYSQFTRLSDEDYVDIAVQAQIDRNRRSFETSKQTRVDSVTGRVLPALPGPETVQYGSVSEFLEQNQNCCSVVRMAVDGFGFGILNPALGFYVVNVRLNYQKLFFSGEADSSSNVWIYGCGKVFEHLG